MNFSKMYLKQVFKKILELEILPMYAQKACAADAYRTLIKINCSIQRFSHPPRIAHNIHTKIVYIFIFTYRRRRLIDKKKFLRAKKSYLHFRHHILNTRIEPRPQINKTIALSCCVRCVVVIDMVFFPLKGCRGAKLCNMRKEIGSVLC